MKRNIAIVFGGYSSEAPVSEKSMLGLLQMMDSQRHNLIPVRITDKEWRAELPAYSAPIDREDFSFANASGQIVKIDFAYITIHGEPGENGQLAGYFEMIGLPHSTCPALQGAVTYNKWVCNNLLRSLGANVAPSVAVAKGESVNTDEILKTVGLPCFVKPAAGGSSFGITKVREAAQLIAAIEKAHSESPQALVEAFLDGAEVTCGLYRTKAGIRKLPLTQVVTKNDFFDYEAKYTQGVTDEITPANIPAEQRDAVWAEAERVYNMLGLRGIVRIDFIISGGKAYPIDINTTPGMTAASFIPQQIRAAGLRTQDVFNEVIEVCAED